MIFSYPVNNLLNFEADVRDNDEFSKSLLKRLSLESPSAISIVQAFLNQQREGLDDIVDMAAHELLEPIRKIITYSDILREDVTSNNIAELTQSADIMAKAARRLNQLVRDLIAFTKIHLLDYQLKEVDLAHSLESASMKLDEILSGSAIITIKDKLPIVKFNENHIETVFFNILQNAVKFTNPAEQIKIEVTAEQKENSWCIGLKDNGIGISEQYLENIFFPFHRLHTREEYPGSGLGLASCRKILHLYGGKVWAESKDKGTAFYILIPDANS